MFGLKIRKFRAGKSDRWMKMNWRFRKIKLLNIAFDLDSTLVDLMPMFEEIVFERYGDTIKKYRGFIIETEKNLPWSKLLPCFHETYRRWEEVIIYPGVEQFLQELYCYTSHDPIRIITARPAYIAANDTYRLCERFGVPFELIMTGNPETMTPGQPECNKFNYLNRYRFFVDDRRKTAIDLSKRGKYVYMPKQTYNDLNGVEYPGLEPIDSVADLYDKIHWFIVEG
jgi:hypothetical protein